MQRSSGLQESEISLFSILHRISWFELRKTILCISKAVSKTKSAVFMIFSTKKILIALKETSLL